MGRLLEISEFNWGFDIAISMILLEHLRTILLGMRGLCADNA